MAVTYTYPDAYLARFCDEDRETRAIADVERLADSASVTFDADWTEKLVIVRTYIIACIENQADKEDLFTAKLKSYRAEYDALIPQAVAAANATTDTVSNIGFMTIPLERG